MPSKSVARNLQNGFRRVLRRTETNSIQTHREMEGPNHITRPSRCDVRSVDSSIATSVFTEFDTMLCLGHIHMRPSDSKYRRSTTQTGQSASKGTPCKFVHNTLITGNHDTMLFAVFSLLAKTHDQHERSLRSPTSSTPSCDVGAHGTKVYLVLACWDFFLFSLLFSR